MLIGNVVGQVVCTRKQPSIEGLKLLIVESAEGEKINMIVTADSIHVAGHGDQVYLLSSTEAVMSMNRGMVCIDSSIVGIVDPKSIVHEKV